jgi:hypothetical protein
MRDSGRRVMLYVSVCVLQPCRICASRSPSALRLQLAPRQRATSAMPSLHHRRPRSQYGRFLRIPRIARRRVSCHVAPVARGYVCSNGMSRLFFWRGIPMPTAATTNCLASVRPLGRLRRAGVRPSGNRQHARVLRGARSRRGSDCATTRFACAMACCASGTSVVC